MTENYIRVIKKAKKLIKKGFTQGSYAVDANGKSVYPVSTKAVAFCILGAVENAAAFDHNMNATTAYKLRNHLFEFYLFELQTSAMEYNDNHTKEEVLASLDMFLDYMKEKKINV